MRIVLPLLTALLLLLGGSAARAQDQSTEDKLRDLLRRATIDLRAAQDSQGQLQADRDAAVKQRDLLQQQLATAQQQLADLAAQQAKQPAAPAATPEALQAAQDQLAEARRQNALLAAGLAKWQAAYREAAALAQAKDAEAKRAGQALQSAQKEDQLGQQTNEKLAATCHDILHLYETTSFRGVVMRSWEPALGLAKVTLDNLIQDYEDRIYDLRLFQKKVQAP